MASDSQAVKSVVSVMISAMSFVFALVHSRCCTDTFAGIRDGAECQRAGIELALDDLERAPKLRCYKSAQRLIRMVCNRSWYVKVRVLLFWAYEEVENIHFENPVEVYDSHIYADRTHDETATLGYMP